MQGPGYREAWLARLTGPAGWYPGPSPPPSQYVPTPHPTHSSPCGLPGPASLGAVGVSLEQLAGWGTGIALLLPTRYTHPARTTLVHRATALLLTAVPVLHPGHAQMTVFRTP